MNDYQSVYAFYFDKYGYIHTRYLNTVKSRRISSNVQQTSPPATYNGEKRDIAPWLRFIIIFWSPRVMRTALKFGVAALIMNRYERLGFAIMMLCFAF